MAAPVGRDGGNILEGVPEGPPPGELLTGLLAAPGLRIERIVSTGQASPPGSWYDQDRAEWVLVLSGAAGLLLEGEAAPRVLGPGDHLLIPPHARHRVEWTDLGRPTVWLAVHHG